MKTILIIAYECAPYNRPGSTIGAQRPYQFAKQLSKLGNKVVLVTSDWKERRTLEKEGLLNLRTNILEQFNSQVNNAWTTISVPSLRFADVWDRWWWKSVITNDKIGTFSPRSGILVTIMRKMLTFIKIFRGDHSQSWQRPALIAIDELVKHIKIDVIIAEHGPDASLYIANKVFKHHKIPWLVDFRDPAERGMPGMLRPIYIKHVKKLIETAQCLINVTPYWAQMDQKRFSKPAYCITNGYDPDDFRFEENHSASDDFVIVYPGSIQPSQNIELFLEGFSGFVQNVNRDAKIIFQYFGSAYKRVQYKTDTLGVERWVQVQPVVERSKALEAMRRADLLLLLSIDTGLTDDLLLSKGVYPGKVFEYFGIGKPILNVPGDSGILDKLIQETGTGVTLKKTKEISDYLYDSYLKSRNGSLRYSAVSMEVEKYNRERQAKKIDEILLETIENKNGN